MDSRNRHRSHYVPAAGKTKPQRPTGRLWVAAGLIFVLALFLYAVTNRTTAAVPEIQSGVQGYCLAVRSHNNDASPVDTQKCNYDQSQAWTVSQTSIRHGHDVCLAVLRNATTVGNKVGTSRCGDEPGQVWLRDKNGFINPNSELCLSLPNNKTGEQLVLASCGLLDRLSEQWFAVDPSAKTATTLCPTAEGARIACYVIHEWTAWQANPANRNALLQQYTDNASYEEWCADFISYAYKEAGYPFTAGVDGWDVNNADDIQNMGFTQHDPASYTPQPGDIAYFNYVSGHVEIVVVGGKHPTFIYGNSADIDPITGNGTMKANTITDDGATGRLVYYLSPNNQ